MYKINEYKNCLIRPSDHSIKRPKMCSHTCPGPTGRPYCWH